MEKLKVAVLGSSGFVGSELLRVLSQHPQVEVVFASSESMAGYTTAKAFPALRMQGPLAQLKLAKLEDLINVDVAFACLPNGMLPRHLEFIKTKSPLIINLGGDYRLRNSQDLLRHYSESLKYPCDNAIYAVPELQSDFPQEGLLNVSGCMSAATIYALYPLCKANLILPNVIADIKTGSSGGGKKASEHSAERSGNIRPHKIHGHQHKPEIIEAIHASTGQQIQLEFSTHSLDLPRGVYATIYVQLKPEVSEQQVRKAFFAAYGQSEFVRYLLPSSHPLAQPMLKSVVGTNRVEVSSYIENDRCVVVSCLDNLIKGAAGQAVQILNQTFGFKNTGYLATQAAWP
jgi:N-acetyl-gamma-glutamyl-phosphate reductase